MVTSSTPLTPTQIWKEFFVVVPQNPPAR